MSPSSEPPEPSQTAPPQTAPPQTERPPIEPLQTGTLRPTMMRPLPPKPTWQIVVGLVLVIPAFVLLIVSYVGPLIWTVNSSFHKVNILRTIHGENGDGGGFTGANYSRAADAGLGRSLGYALSLAIVPILVVLVAGPVLAWAAHTGGLVARWVTRALLAVPLAAYAPTAIAVAQFASRRGQVNGENVNSMARAMYWWGTFGLFAALAVTLFLATLRRRDPARRAYPAVVVAAIIALAATLAATLQEFVFPYLITFHRGATPVTLMFQLGFQAFDFGTGAAVSVVLMVPLILLGVGVTLLVVVSGLRIEFDKPWRSADERTTPPTVRAIGLVVGGVILLAVFVLTLIGLWPLLGHLGDGTAGGRSPSPATVAVNTWVPTLISAFVGVLVATLAAAGISWLRPFGRHSEWLLLPFGLFLFVGMGPLALRAYANGAVAGRLNSLLGLIPPVWVTIPALFVLALMLRGQALRGEALRQEGRSVAPARLLLPVLPMLGVVFGVTWVVQAQDLIWPLISAANPKHMPATVALVQYVSGPGAIDQIPYSLVLPIGGFVLLLLLVIGVQLAYLDRVALRVGLPERDYPPRT